MKYRKDFVTNSSSSSFVCEICGRTEGGFDLGPSDVGMCECVNNHIFCQNEMFKINNINAFIDYILDGKTLKVWNSASNSYAPVTKEVLQHYSDDELLQLCYNEGIELPEFLCPICQFEEYSEYDLSEYLEKEYKVSRDEVFEEVKKINKRRKKLYENEYITEVCKRFNLNPAEIVNQWKKTFKTYKEFRNFLNS